MRTSVHRGVEHIAVAQVAIGSMAAATSCPARPGMTSPCLSIFVTKRYSSTLFHFDIGQSPIEASILSYGIHTVCCAPRVCRPLQAYEYSNLSVDLCYGIMVLWLSRENGGVCIFAQERKSKTFTYILNYLWCAHLSITSGCSTRTSWRSGFTKCEF